MTISYNKKKLGPGLQDKNTTANKYKTSLNKSSTSSNKIQQPLKTPLKVLNNWNNTLWEKKELWWWLIYMPCRVAWAVSITVYKADASDHVCHSRHNREPPPCQACSWLRVKHNKTCTADHIPMPWTGNSETHNLQAESELLELCKCPSWLKLSLPCTDMPIWAARLLLKLRWHRDVIYAPKQVVSSLCHCVIWTHVVFGRFLYSVRDCETLCLDCCVTLPTTLLALDILWRLFSRVLVQTAH